MRHHRRLVLPGDPRGLNWLRDDFGYAQVRFLDSVHERDHGSSPPLEVEVVTTDSDGLWTTTVHLRNATAKPYASADADLAITLPLQDRYDLASGQADRRCHAHLFCAGTSSYVMALRMSGEPPHLGLVLTAGALDGYSVERDRANSSNDRGCFLLHPAPFVLGPGESTTLAWTMFAFDTHENFWARAGEVSRFVRAQWSSHVLFPGEAAELTVRPSFACDVVLVDDQPITADGDGVFRYRFAADTPGERAFVIHAAEQWVRTRVIVEPPVAELAERRCRFIAHHQQYRGPVAQLQGALLAYDNDTDTPFYSTVNDYNAGRERVGMGLTLVTFLLALRAGVLTTDRPDTEAIVRRALDDYVAFVRRELVDESSGEVFNDLGRDNSDARLYNSPWYATLLLTLYELDGRPADLLAAVQIVRRYYADGGARFYPIELPIVALDQALGEAGLHDLRAELQGHYREHAAAIVATGLAYPAHEVNYEQSIVAPAVDVLLQTALVTESDDLLQAAAPHIAALEQFQGMQPDHHLNQVAIRHWDDYWFGKDGQLGDTLPHHWSGLSGNCLALLYRRTGDPDHAARARASLRAVLPLIRPDGRGSCAFVFPRRVNGTLTRGFNPMANDQDWALFFALRSLMRPGPAAIC